jgi:lipopolysaccharide transport system permease protein
MRNLRHHKDLILYKTWADLRSESGRYYLSFIWWILDPVLLMFVFYVVFGLGLRSVSTEHFVPFLLIGIITWRWFEATVNHCTNSIQASRALVQQVSLPKIIFPLVTVCKDTFRFLIAFVLIVVFVNIYGLWAGPAYLSLPAILLVQLMLIMALGILFACLTPFLPDFALLVTYPIRMLFFMSGVFYDIGRIPEKYKFLFFYNPMARLIQSYREILMFQEWPDSSALLAVGAGSVGGLCVAIWLILKLDKSIPRALAR